MDRWEIINPHDKAYLHGDDVSAVMFAICALGNGWYGAIRERDGFKIPVSPFIGEADLNAWCKEHTPHATFHALCMASGEAAADVLDSLSYNGERTSMTDMGSNARRLARALRGKPARCLCGHHWRLRGINQISDIPGWEG